MFQRKLIIDPEIAYENTIQYEVNLTLKYFPKISLVVLLWTNVFFVVNFLRARCFLSKADEERWKKDFF